MRLGLLFVPGALAGAFMLGHATSAPSAAASSTGHIYTGRASDVFRAPSAAVRCLVSAEAGAADLLCSHTPRARYQVVFYKNNLFVFRNGNPDTPVFSAHGRP